MIASFSGDKTSIAVSHDFPEIGRRVMLINARESYEADDLAALLVVAIEDITERKEREARLAADHKLNN